METTIDAALGGRLKLRQPAKGYRFAIDPILLAACCPARPGGRVADLGCGIGIAALAIARRVAGIACHGIDKLAPMVELANQNANGNGLGDRVTFGLGDIGRWRQSIDPGTFDHVVANPPHHAQGAMTISPDPIKAAATREDSCGLVDWAEAAMGALRQGGDALFVHRADRLADVLAAFGPRFGAILVLPIHPRQGALARRIVVFGRKGSRAPMQLLPGLVLHEPDGSWSEAARRVLEDAQALDLEKISGGAEAGALVVRS